MQTRTDILTQVIATVRAAAPTAAFFTVDSSDQNSYGYRLASVTLQDGSELPDDDNGGPLYRLTQSVADDGLGSVSWGAIDDHNGFAVILMNGATFKEVPTASVRVNGTVVHITETIWSIGIRHFDVHLSSGRKLTHGQYLSQRPTRAALAEYVTRVTVA